MSDAVIGKDTTKADDVVEPKITTLDNGEAILHVPPEKTIDRPSGRDPDAEDGDDNGDAGQMSSNRRRRERQKQARKAGEQQIMTLSTAVYSQQRMIEALARGQTQTALATLEREANDARSAYTEGQRRHAAAVTAGDGAAATEAQTVMNNANAYYTNVAGQHKILTARLSKTTPVDDDDTGGNTPGSADRPREDAPPKMTDRQMQTMTEYKEDFLDDHPFIDPDSTDPRQVAITAIDTQVAREGFKPWTKDYWDELKERIAEAGLDKGGKRVERRREQQDDPQPRRRTERRRADDDDDSGGPPLGAANRGSSGKTIEVRLDAEMVNNLEQAGLPLTGGTPEQKVRRAKIMAAWAGGRPSAATAR